jgi:predicted HAD superfamily Cof-like phosphohydrolase
MRKSLNVRQERFCEFIAAGESQTDAWIKAGHKVKRNVAKSAANRALTNVDLNARIAELRKPVYFTPGRKKRIGTAPFRGHCQMLWIRAICKYSAFFCHS